MERPPRTDEPRRHRLFMALLGLVALATSPFAFVGSETVFLLGIPLWLWSSSLFTAGLSVLTAWGFWRYWRDDGLD